MLHISSSMCLGTLAEPTTYESLNKISAVNLTQAPAMAYSAEETLCAQARNATVSKTLITPTPNTTHTNPQSSWGDIM